MSIQRLAPTEPDEFWQIFLRRRLWVIVPALVVCCVVLVVSITLPRFYRSETLILVDPQKVPAEYVRSTVSSDASDRLQAVSQEILSRTRLQQMIDQFGLYKSLRGSDSQENIVELMRKDITLDIEADKDPRRHASVAFRIAYVNRDPLLAQQVARQIGSWFIEENLKVREAQAEGTSEFVGSELDKAREALQVQESRIEAFKGKHMGSLPEQEQANLQVLGQMQALIQANSDAISRAQQEKTYLESLLQIQTPQAALVPRSNLSAELDARRAELISLEQKYTPTHPDIVRLRQQVRSLEAKVKSLSAEDAGAGHSNVEPGQIKSHMAALETEIKERAHRQADLEAKVKSVQGKIETLPAVEQQYAEINRDYEISKANYRALLEKRNASSMAAEMEHKAKGEQFRILDPASFPERPYKPDLLELWGLGALAAVAAGLATGALREWKDRSIRTEKQVAYYLSAPVLGVISMIPTEGAGGMSQVGAGRLGSD